MIEHFKKYWAAHITWISTLVFFLDPSIQAYFAQHPKTSAAFAGIWSLLLLTLKSPVAGKLTWKRENV